MCSVGDDYTDEKLSKYMPTIDKTLKLETTCNKCRANNPSVLLRHKDAYCKECFLQATTHKFKAFLGKHRFIYPNDSVLVIYEDGHPCTALLHFIRSGLDLTTPKKLKFEAIVLYPIRDSNSITQEHLNKVKEHINSFGFRSYCIALDHLDGNDINENLNDQFTVPANIGNTKVVDRLNETAREELLSLKEKKLYVHIAKKLKCSCVMTSELGIDVASQLLTNISLGRGAHISLDVGPYDDRYSNVKIIRPLRNFEMKELAMYNYFYNVEPISIIGKALNATSIQNLMKNFVSGLQTNFPATITTIVRTGDKLSLDDTLKDNEKCALCLAPLENRTEDLTSPESTKFSHFLSTQTPNYNLSPVDRYNNSLQSFTNKQKSPYCFACDKLSAL